MSLPKCIASIALCLAVAFLTARAGERGKPAWPDVFVNLGMYAVAYETPVVGKDDKNVYQQKASYTWSGGRFEIIHVTLARDPGFKDRYSADALKKEKNPPKELEINKKRALHWKLVDEDKAKLTDVTSRLVVLLADDKALIIEQVGQSGPPEGIAKRFDFDKIEKALAKPPGKTE